MPYSYRYALPPCMLVKRMPAHLPERPSTLYAYKAYALQLPVRPSTLYACKAYALQLSVRPSTFYPCKAYARKVPVRPSTLYVCTGYGCTCAGTLHWYTMQRWTYFEAGITDLLVQTGPFARTAGQKGFCCLL